MSSKDGRVASALSLATSYVSSCPAVGTTEPEGELADGDRVMLRCYDVTMKSRGDGSPSSQAGHTFNPHRRDDRIFP